MAIKQGLQFDPSQVGLDREAIAQRAQVPVITADSLTNRPKQVNLPQPKLSTQPSQFVNTLQPAINQAQQGLIQAQTEEANQRNDVLNRLLNVEDPNSQQTYDSRFNQLKGNDYLKQFTDANTRLAQLQGVFNTGSQKVSSAPGQSQVFEGLQLNEVSRQKAVEVGNQALVVQALQGNVETARQIALDTTRFASEDRANKLQSLMAQFQSLDGIVQGQEKQLIDTARIKAEQEYDQLKRTQATIDTAIQSGAASTEEMMKLADPSLTDEEKLFVAQSIVARGAMERLTFDQSNTMFGQNMAEREFSWDIAKNGATMNPDGTFNFAPSTPKTSWQEINGKRVLVNDETGEIITDPTQIAATQPDPTVLAQGKSNIDQITNVLSGSGLNSVVGPNGFGRWSIANALRGKSSNAIADIQQITEQLTLDKLIQAKANGATFGALSDGERQMLASSASKIGTWAIKDKDGNVKGYNASEKDFRAELDRINNFAKLDFIKKGGNPAEVGVAQMPDGTVWTSNSNGTKTQLFNTAGNASASNQVKGTQSSLAPLPLLNMDGNPKTPNIPLAKAYPQGSYGGQCGVWVRSIVEKSGLTYPRVGNSLAEKRATALKFGVPLNKARPGSVLLTAENKTSGHVAYIMGANKNGFILAESNYAQPEKVSYGRVIPFNSPQILGVINPVKG